MSILIKGMEMPKNCRICPCFQYDMFDDDIDGYCKALKTKIMNRSKHHPDCPLIELPPHGRLIDLDKFKSDYGMNDECAKCDKELRGSVRECETNFSYRKMDFCGWLDDAPTVIEAEGSETDA